MSDSPRMLELRRRVQADPASIAFAQLAEECRRIGHNDEAVYICRAGLARNSSYLSARITLGRALIELGQLDDAKAELELVVAGVPNNLAAIRGLAEIYQRRGQMPTALEYYRRALELAKDDPDLEDTVERISQAVAPAPPPRPTASPVAVEDLFDFDSLIQQLAPETLVPEVSASAAEGRFGETSPELANDLGASEGGSVAAHVPSVLDSVELKTDDTDSLAVIERELRELDEQRAIQERAEQVAIQQEQAARAAEQAALQEQAARAAAQASIEEQAALAALAKRRHDAALAALESWLATIVADRQRHGA